MMERVETGSFCSLSTTACRKCGGPIGLGYMAAPWHINAHGHPYVYDGGYVPDGWCPDGFVPEEPCIALLELRREINESTEISRRMAHHGCAVPMASGPAA